MEYFIVTFLDDKKYRFLRVKAKDLWDALMIASLSVNYRIHWVEMKAFPESLIENL